MSPLTELITGAKAYGWSSFSIPPAFESIATSTVSGSSTNTVTFSSISSSYQHLQLRLLVRSTATSGGSNPLLLKLNSLTSYPYHILRGNGTTVASQGSTANTGIFLEDALPVVSNTSNYAVGIIDILDYQSTTKNKTVKAFHGYDNNGAGFVYLTSGLGITTSAITSISISTSAPTEYFIAGSTVALYGIKGA